MPEFKVAAPGGIRCGQNGDASREVKRDAKIAAVVAVDENAAEEGNQQAGSGGHDDLVADLDGRMGEGEDMPADPGKVHSAPEERDKHGEEKIAEAGLRPEERAVGRRRCGGGG